MDDPEDLVRREIAMALRRGIPVFPVGVSGGRLPVSEDLPEELRDLCRRQAHELTENDFRHDLDGVIEALDEALSTPGSGAFRLAAANQPVEGSARYKVCMVGSYGVGKTSLVKRFVESMFDERYLTTIGVKIDKKLLTVGTRHVALRLWDLAGEDETTGLRTSYLMGSAGYILVVDGLRSQTLENAFSLRRRVEESVGRIPFVVAVNKADLRHAWQVDDAAVKGLSSDAPVFETSAKSGQNVEEMFRSLAGRLLSKGGTK